jgi:general stress protein 26
MGMRVAALMRMANMKTPIQHQESTELRNYLSLARSGELHARPMSIAKLEDNGDLWFVTRLDTPKVDELARDSRTTVIMQGKNKYLRVAGHSVVLRDKEKIHELWTESMRIWFDDESDPRLVLIKVNAYEAEYWDVSGKEGIKFALKAAKALLTGDKNDVKRNDAENHGKVRL